MDVSSLVSEAAAFFQQHVSDLSTGSFIKDDDDDDDAKENLRKGRRRKESETDGIIPQDILDRSLLSSKPNNFLPHHKLRKHRTDAPSSGNGWFNLQSSEITPQIQQHLELLDSKRFLFPHLKTKTDRRSKKPEFMQVGTVIEGKQEFFSSRLTKKDRNKTLAQELLKDSTNRNRIKNKFLMMQAKKNSGGKNSYKKRQQAKDPKWKNASY